LEAWANCGCKPSIGRALLGKPAAAPCGARFEECSLPVAVRRMKRFTVLLGVLQFLLALQARAGFGAGPAQIDHQIEGLRRAYGVRVHYHYDPATYFSKRWLEKPISAKGSQLELDEVERFIPIIDTFLTRHPEGVIKKNLEDIYISKTLEFYGKPFGGSNSKTAIYFHSEGKDRGYTDEFVEEGLHHEFSSILMRNYTFPKDEWSRINPPGFSYGKSGVEVIGQKALHGQTEELLTQGFLEKYCQSTMENDFNVVSAWLFVRPDDLKRLAAKYEKIAAKRRSAINFYKSVDKEYKF
jgi:Putative zinc-binding metallo-peptidase